MSARVFNPVVMSEMKRMLCAGSASGAVAFPETVDQSPALVATRRRPDGAAVARVRRVLFEPVDHEDTRQFVENELALQQERDSERWGFDFLHEKERSSGPGSKRYVWEKVTPHEKIPEPYALRGMEYLGKCAIDGDDAPAPAAATTVVASAETTKTTKQTSISDFLKERKRTCSVAKSVSVGRTTITTTTATTEVKKARISNS
ncbi:uncharacterized protein LOC111870937 [Cryptotermes secundus]|uniref:uncharacterized protein LOC111870937 n=1 Tax=Cryptotermes secundus TaxID=105785 RepID=UPI000CD7BA51|nr:uncharacterized protein LOC111870937 [Cryptotermes secundus]